MKHTPGPWKVDDNSIVAQFEGGEAQVATMGRTSWSHPDGGKTARLRLYKEANARLIATSPLLLQELVLIVEGWDNIEQHKIRPLTDWEVQRREFARATIAKAKGKL